MNDLFFRVAETVQAIDTLRRHLAKFSDEDFEKCYMQPKSVVESLFGEHAEVLRRLAARALIGGTAFESLLDRGSDLVDRLRAIALHEKPV